MSKTKSITITIDTPGELYAEKLMEEGEGFFTVIS